MVAPRSRLRALHPEYREAAPGNSCCLAFGVDNSEGDTKATATRCVWAINMATNTPCTYNDSPLHVQVNSAMAGRGAASCCGRQCPGRGVDALQARLCVDELLVVTRGLRKAATGGEA